MLADKYTKRDSGVWAATDADFNYSDGDEVENRILRQIQEAEDVSRASDELQQYMVDWPSEYHFTPLRSNLLSSFHLQKFATILEVGSGCGAISRGLGEQCPDSEIIALEGSMRRAEITRARCRDLTNVTVCRDSFADFEHPTPFDLITMIGVLEYSPAFFAGDSPVKAALGHARQLLHDNGVLVVAVENQLGLKYFNGCGEDHNGLPFFGIENRYEPGTFRTFGKKELQKQLQDAGFGRVEFVYPFPDYKLPRLLLREEAFSCESFAAADLIGQYPSRDYSRDNGTLFDEASVWASLAENGMVQDLANSFLVFAFSDDRDLTDITDPWIGKAYSCPRKKRYLVETVFYETGSGLPVDKKLSYPAAANIPQGIGKSITHHPEKAAYIEGSPYADALAAASGDEMLESFIRYLNPWVEWLFTHGLPAAQDADKAAMLPGTLYDCIPANFIVDDGHKLHLIDQEWEHADPLEPGFLLFRGIYSELSRNISFFEESDLFDGRTAGDIITEIFTRFDLVIDEAILQSYIEKEVDVQLQLVVYPVSRKQLCQVFHGFLHEERKKRLQFADLLQAGGVRCYEEALKNIDHLNEENTLLKDQLDAVFSSKSWKLTSGLRGLGSIAGEIAGKVSALYNKRD